MNKSLIPNAVHALIHGNTSVVKKKKKKKQKIETEKIAKRREKN